MMSNLSNAVVCDQMREKQITVLTLRSLANVSILMRALSSKHCSASTISMAVNCILVLNVILLMCISFFCQLFVVGYKKNPLLLVSCSKK